MLQFAGHSTPFAALLSAAAFFLVSTELAVGQANSAVEKDLPLPGEVFRLKGSTAFLIAPKEGKQPQPWVWYAPTLKGLPSGAEAWMFEKFLDAGIAIAGIDVGESFGNPAGCREYTYLYDCMVHQRGFCKRPVLLARSRGGLMLYNWASEHADQVSAIAGIYPVCNLSSYPGLAKAAKAYDLPVSKLELDLAKHNPVDRLEALAQKQVPILHLHGDQDRVVPLAENSALLEARYRALAGPITIRVVEGQGHNMWKGWFQSQELVQFVLDHAFADCNKE